jgi:tetratricopeptide (TPR) repeat protein
MNNVPEMLLTNTLSTPMIYYNAYNYSPEEIELRYGSIKFGTAEDLKEYFEAGVNALQNKNTNMAISNFSKVTEMVPTFIPAVNNLGALYYSIGRLPESIHFFEQGIRKDPKNFQVRYNLGTLYCLNRNFQLAKDQLSQAKSLLPHDPAINNNLALSLLNLEDNSQEAIELFSDLTNKYNTFDIAFHNYGHILTQQKKYEEAITYYEQALEKNNNSIVTLNDMACCYYKKGNTEKALQILDNIITSSGNQFQPATYNLGYIVATKRLLPFEEYAKN